MNAYSANKINIIVISMHHAKRKFDMLHKSNFDMQHVAFAEVIFVKYYLSWSISIAKMNEKHFFEQRKKKKT